jgi:hypothetical protein
MKMMKPETAAVFWMALWFVQKYREQVPMDRTYNDE